MALPYGRSRLHEHFARTGKRQVDLADFLGVTESFISQAANNQANFSLIQFKNASIFFKCEMEDLIFWDESQLKKLADG
jgi:transcriptional regulator with XRE-family HTH domain